MNFDNLHQILAKLYEDMLPLCSDMIGIAKASGRAGCFLQVLTDVCRIKIR